MNREHVRFSLEIAARKAGVEGWRWFAMEALNDDDVLFEGAVPSHLRGPGVGRLAWRDDAAVIKVAVTRREVVEAARAFEAETGFCSRCLGQRRVHRWVDRLYQRASCPACAGTGLATATGRIRVTPSCHEVAAA